MVEPGLFKHFKGKFYRVLFVAEWWNGRGPGKLQTLQADQELHVSAAGYDHTLWLHTYKSVTSEARDLLVARWSGNGTSVQDKERVVIYVALYDGGRVAARTETEFEEIVEAPNRAPFEDANDHARQARFTRISG